jgi:hypothetical protein
MKFLNHYTPLAAANDLPPAGGVTPPADTPPAADPPPADTPTPAFSWVNPDGTFVADWHKAAALPDTFAKFKTVADLGKSYSSLEAKLGAEKIPLPKTPDDKEGWAAVWDRLGRPPTPDDYGLKRPDALPEAFWNADGAKDFANAAHELGLTKTQVETLFAWQTRQTLTALHAQETTAAATRDANVAALQKELGPRYHATLGLAKRILEQAGVDTANSSYAQDPVVIKLAAAYGEAIGERAPVGIGNSVKPQATLDEELSAIEKDPAYFDRTNAKHADLVKRRTALINQKYGAPT